MSAVRRFTQAAGLALAAGAVGLATAGTASAITSADDAAFLADIRHEGISYESPVEVISNARAVCAELDSGTDATDIGLDILSHTDLTTRQAAAFVVTAIGYYCPQHTGAFA